MRIKHIVFKMFQPVDVVPSEILSLKLTFAHLFLFFLNRNADLPLDFSSTGFKRVWFLLIPHQLQASG